MRHFAIFVITTFACAIFCISCNTHNFFTNSDLAGFFVNKKQQKDNDIWTAKKEDIDAFYRGDSSGFDSVRKADYEGKIAYLKGDTASTYFSYAAFHKLPTGSLNLNKDGSFEMGAWWSDNPNICGLGMTRCKGKWELNGNDAILLALDSFPQDTARILSLIFENQEFSGKRRLKILGKNKLLFEYKPFHAKNGEKIRIIYTRLK